MNVLFVLWPEGEDLDEFFAKNPAAQSAAAQTTLRRYPRASDQRHIFSLVRDGRDRYATQWLKGLLLAIAAGAVIGATLNGILAIAFDMFGGLASLAIPLGFILGTFLATFTAVMTGTHTARKDLRPLLRQTQPGDTLLQFQSPNPQPLQTLRPYFPRVSTVPGQKTTNSIHGGS